MVLASQTCSNTAAGSDIALFRDQRDMKQEVDATRQGGGSTNEYWQRRASPPRWSPPPMFTGKSKSLDLGEKRVIDLDEPESGEDSEDDVVVKSEPDIATPNASLIRLQSRRERRSNSVKRKPRSQPQIRPLSVLQRGNADPFNTAGIMITPQVNQILAFARDICLPAFYFQDSLRDSSISAKSSRDVTNPSGWISSPAARRGWQQVVDALSDKCTALACLSTYLALMAACQINPTKATEASLKMRAGSSALLRQQLLRQDSSNSTVKARQELLWQVFWHFYAEFFAGNLEAAQIHGKMLRQSCEAAEEGVITPHFLDSVLFVDTHMSAKYMTRTVFDIDKWIPDVFAPIWEKIDPDMANITQEDGSTLHATIKCDPLRSIFLRTRQSIILLRQSAESHSVDIDYDTLFYWLNSHAYVDGGRVIDLYLMLIDKALHAPKVKPDPSRPPRPIPIGTETAGYLYTEACLCLCSLYSIRDVGQEIPINGIDIVDASSTIGQHLRESIIQALTSCTPEERKTYRPAHLWCAYIGALMEQREADPSSRTRTTSLSDVTKVKAEPTLRRAATVSDAPASSTFSTGGRDPSMMPFNSLLAEVAHSMVLLSWQQVADMLKQFIYTDTAEPHGSRWFWKTMGAYLDRRKRFMEQKQRQQATQAQRDPSVLEKQRSNESDKSSFSRSSTGQAYMASPRRWSTAGGTQVPRLTKGKTMPNR